jgi:antitoxin PrlF
VVKATLTSKGQLTIPKEVRERLGSRSGDRVVFELEDDSARMKVERRKSLEELKGSLPTTREYSGKEADRAAARESAAERLLDGSS